MLDLAADAAELTAALVDVESVSGDEDKLAGLVDTGSEAKQLLATGGVTVNDEVELRRGRQLVHGDVVVAHDRAVRVLLAGGPAS